MSKNYPPTLVEVAYLTHTAYYIYDEKERQWGPLDESRLAQAIPGYKSLNEKARKRKFKKFIKRSEIIQKIKLPKRLSHVPKKWNWRRLSWKKIPAAVKAILSIVNIFDSARPGYLLLADLLCGLHGTSLRKAEATFCPAISVRSSSPEILSILKCLMKAVIPRKRWKKKKFRIDRTAVLDYRTDLGEFPTHIQDFSQVKCFVPGYKKLRFPVPYSDIVVLLVGADKSQIREATPYIDKAAVLLLNCETGDLAPTKLSSADVAAYDPNIVSQLKDKRNHIAALLDWWRMPFKKEDAWARGIVQEARASFGKPDSRYIRVELDPKKLRDVIRYRVLLSFFDELEDCGFITAEELAPYRQDAKDVFDPEPPEPVANRHAEDPDVFLEIMRGLAANPPAAIVAEGERFVKKDKPLAAWRTIGTERYLVFPEEGWAKTYKKSVQAKKTIDPSFFQRERWERELQKILCEKDLIKRASSGYRYRYDLLENGTRDSTYVVAVPAHLLAE